VKLGKVSDGDSFVNAERVSFNKDLFLLHPFHKLGLGFVELDIAKCAVAEECASYDEVLLLWACAGVDVNGKVFFEVVFVSWDLALG